MTNQVKTIAAAVRRGPRSFDYIRSTTGLGLTDDQFRAVIAANRGRFKLVRFLKRNDEGGTHPPRSPRRAAEGRARLIRRRRSARPSRLGPALGPRESLAGRHGSA